ncbi:DNA mismatch repair endonuclease MutL [candidate division WOR-3 bacterium]|nr:DNA mismatch repair endonuclease MutL [candidate division WOR-3 bacterium]
MTRAEPGRIRSLPEDVVRRIAAGEVVARPAAALKELVENALDAGATEVRVDLKNGGKNLLRVSDNGCGMGREDSQLAIARHATSKLTSIEDLRRVTSYGFRGEALASIAAVSRFVLETNDEESRPGTRVEVDGGEIRSVRETVHPRGTTVTCRTLFFNLAPRRAFLKSDSYEGKLCVETVRCYALVFPGVGFEVTNDDRVVFRLPPAAGIRERMADLFDKSAVEGLVEVRVENPLVRLQGFLSAPGQARPYYDVQQVYFNRRPVQSRLVARAVLDAYGPSLDSNRPNFLLSFHTDPSRLDVNIHPTKHEVRFADERFLFDFVSEACRKVLGTVLRRESGVDDLPVQSSFDTGSAGPTGFWQLHNSYILAQVASGYVIIDQHAAHERVMFEELAAASRQVAPQGLLFPITIELGADEFEAYQSFVAELAAMGVETKVFSGRTVVVETVPSGSYIGKADLREFFAELPGLARDSARLRPELARLVACKAAVKAGQMLSPLEMESLCNRLFACREPYFCPHGRPAIIKIATEELERRFGRT